jgi:hypothetical protein
LKFGMLGADAREMAWIYHRAMPFPIKTCALCGEEFELRPGKPGFANRCPSCSEPEESDANQQVGHHADADLNAARRSAIRDLLYRKES